MVPANQQPVLLHVGGSVCPKSVGRLWGGDTMARGFRVALLILDSRLAPTTSTVRGGPGQHLEKRIDPWQAGQK